MSGARGAALVALVVLLFGCGSSAPVAPRSAGESITSWEPSSARTLVLATRVEVTSLSPAPFWKRRFTFLSTPRLFNADLTLFDKSGDPHPYLAEALPALNTDSWRVMPDGRMETTYRLRPNLVWQDSTPLSAEDFVFGWRLLTTPELGAPTSQPQGLMEQVSAPDARTVLIRWRQLYPDAGTLSNDFEP